MTTTIESIKKIAKFMGHTIYPNDTKNKPASMMHILQKDIANYHSSWEPLMNVVDHIESLGYVSTIEKLNLEHDSHRVYFNKKGSLEEVARGARDESKFVAIYMAVEDFINWYNKLKK